MAGVAPFPMLVPRSPAALTTVGTAESDDGVMCRVQGGQVQELSLLFERHQAPLLNFFLLWLHAE